MTEFGEGARSSDSHNSRQMATEIWINSAAASIPSDYRESCLGIEPRERLRDPADTVDAIEKMTGDLRREKRTGATHVDESAS